MWANNPELLLHIKKTGAFLHLFFCIFLDGTEFYFTIPALCSRINQKEVFFLEDMEKTLEELQQELIEEELVEEENDQLDALLEEFLNEPTPAFEEPDSTVATGEAGEYRNFSNDYGAQISDEEYSDEQQEELTPEQLRKRQQDERVILGLMIFASVECVGILAILVYWLKMFL